MPTAVCACGNQHCVSLHWHLFYLVPDSFASVFLALCPGRPTLGNCANWLPCPLICNSVKTKEKDQLLIHVHRRFQRNMQKETGHPSPSLHPVRDSECLVLVSALQLATVSGSCSWAAAKLLSCFGTCLGSKGDTKSLSAQSQKQLTILKTAFLVTKRR